MTEHRHVPLWSLFVISGFLGGLVTAVSILSYAVIADKAAGASFAQVRDICQLETLRARAEAIDSLVDRMNRIDRQTNGQGGPDPRLRPEPPASADWDN